MEPVYHLFVYGSLRKGFQSDAYQYISRYFKLCGSAKVKGILFDLGPYPAAVPGDDGQLDTTGDEPEKNKTGSKANGKCCKTHRQI